VQEISRQKLSISVFICVNANLKFVDKFCYLGDMLSVDGDADAAVKTRVQVGVSMGSWCHCLPMGMYHWW